MFLPILPTTPFLLLAAYCFVRSNRRLYDKLLSHKVLGPYISDFMLHKTIPKKVKVVSILTLWITIAVSVLLVKLLWVKILLLGIAVGVSAHILSFKSR
ncbi:MAG: YbaN family protein [Bacteroidales bacterium]|nr:YbaN family protein [Bacteroidales bacterium]MCI7662444.1 YbaN family protein [Bacteroidales bacterium]